MANWGKIVSRGNVEDRRSYRPAAIGGVSLAGLALYFLVNYLAGGNFSDALNNVGQVAFQEGEPRDTSQYEGQDSYEVFVSEVLGSNNDYWSSVFADSNHTYIEPKLVLFRDATQSACGGATSDVGPHYCSLDNTIYLDETFFDELTNRFGAKGGDVAEAYVISHEVGHHVQTELGTMSKVNQMMESGVADTNALSVKLELQADCYAGLWANSINDQGILEPNEIQEAMDAASAVGDDRIQKRVTGYINPENFTHGSSEERLQWFSKGYNSGSLESCNTFQ